MPAFKTASQLATWRAEMAAKPTSHGASAEEFAFFTGKPYIDASGGYAFKYRSYNPELARWTSEDPSGFPDGANNQYYAPPPTSGLDATGLFYTGAGYLPAYFGRGNSLDDQLLWTAGYFTTGTLGGTGMNHADGSTPGDWSLDSAQTALVKTASESAVMKSDTNKLWTAQVAADLKSAFGSKSSGSYSWS